MSNQTTDNGQDPAVVADLEELANRVAQHPNPEHPVIFYGSSSFRLWDPKIRTDLNSSSIVNLAFGGSTLASCGQQFDRIMQPYQEPRSMVVYAGDNDLGDGCSALEVKSRFLRVLEKIESRFGRLPIFFVSIKPSPSKQPIFDVIVETNRLIREEIDRRDHLHYIDIFAPMLTGSGRSNPAFFMEDMLHMNDAGYQVWKKVIGDQREAIGL
jgi:lysophospholipase L1-like esterase